MKTGPKPMGLAARFSTKYRVDESGCWIWTSATGNSGYGHMLGEPIPGKRSGRQIGAHIASHLIYKGPVPAGAEVDHLCRVPLCVNPEHLEAVTPRENKIRAARHRARPEACTRGHVFDEENTAIRPDGGRRCRACARLRNHTRGEGRTKALGPPRLVVECVAGRCLLSCGHSITRRAGSQARRARCDQCEAGIPAAEVEKARAAGMAGSAAALFETRINNVDKKECRHGHPFDQGNTLVLPNGRRQCRTCTARRQREYQARKRLATGAALAAA